MKLDALSGNSHSTSKKLPMSVIAGGNLPLPQPFHFKLPRMLGDDCRTAKNALHSLTLRLVLGRFIPLFEQLSQKTLAARLSTKVVLDHLPSTGELK